MLTPLPLWFCIPPPGQAMLRELREMEPEAKWPLASSAHILSLLGDGATALTEAEAHELADALATLQRIDPARTHFYSAQAQRTACLSGDGGPTR